MPVIPMYVLEDSAYDTAEIVRDEHTVEDISEENMFRAVAGGAFALAGGYAGLEIGEKIGYLKGVFEEGTAGYIKKEEIIYGSAGMGIGAVTTGLAGYYLSGKLVEKEE